MELFEVFNLKVYITAVGNNKYILRLLLGGLNVIRDINASTHATMHFSVETFPTGIENNNKAVTNKSYCSCRIDFTGT